MKNQHTWWGSTQEDAKVKWERLSSFPRVGEVVRNAYGGLFNKGRCKPDEVVFLRPWREKVGAARMRGISGFTLIELLVVVLIIGLLTAVALPQYNKAIKKSRATEVLVALDTLDKALSDYYLEHGNYVGVGPNTLNIEIPELKDFRYTVGTGGSYENGSSTLMSESFKDGQPGYANMSIKNQQLDIQINWSAGKRVSRTCQPKNGEKSCHDYFSHCPQVGSCSRL